METPEVTGMMVADGISKIRNIDSWPNSKKDKSERHVPRFLISVKVDILLNPITESSSTTPVGQV